MASVSDFIHGVLVKEIPTATKPIALVRTAVIAAIGTAPPGSEAAKPENINKPILVGGDLEAARVFGERKPGYSLPYDVAAWRDHNSGIFIGVNVFDPTTMLNVDPGTPQTFANDEIDLGANNVEIISIKGTAQHTAYEKFSGTDEIQLPNATGTFVFASDAIDLGFVGAVVIAVKSANQKITYALAADYTVANGVITREGARAIPADATVWVEYSFVVVAKVESLDGDEFTGGGTDYTATGGLLTRAEGAIAPGSMVKITYTVANVTFAEGIDYEADAIAGKITRLSLDNLGARIPPNAMVTVAFEYPDMPTEADIIGQTTAESIRTGLQALFDAYPTFGIEPKIIIACGYSHHYAVAREMEIVAAKLRAICIIDAPRGATRNQVLEGRGGGGSVNAFFTSSDRAILCWPHVKVYDPATNSDVQEPMSRRVAGVICQTDSLLNPWFSPSNKPIKKVIALEAALTFGQDDPGSDVNLLNAAGVTTIWRDYGTGWILWGNYTAKFPNSADMVGFISVRRTMDLIHESIERATRENVDLPIHQIAIQVPATVNAFLDFLKGQGAILGGQCQYFPTNNPPTELAKGNIIFDLDATPPPPAQRITFQSTINIDYLNRVGEVVGSSQTALAAA
ncbi:MAG: phage tail sheath subtilisin-like domain-containing protein [Cyanobacteria bacterium P01_E01_bin.42]